MVGIPGKSQGCNTCRQRRIKCDLREPCCLRCIKSRRECTGYNREAIFVNRTTSNPSATVKSALSQIRAQQPKNIATYPRIEADLRYLFRESSQRSHEFREYAAKLLEAIYLPKQPASGNVQTGKSEGAFSWVYRLTDLVQPSKSLDTSLFAFCLAQLHVTGIGDASLYQCLDQYSTALQLLYSDLDDPERRFREETLATIVVLSTCEIFVSPVERTWGIHACGIAEILRLRDPGMAVTPAWRHLFSRMRLVCTIEALTRRQAKILEDNIWRQIVTGAGLTGPLDELYRMIADMPSMLERAVALSSIGDLQVLLREASAVAGSLFAMLRSVETWHDEFWKASSNPRAWLIPSGAVNPADVDTSQKVFPLCFDFESISVAIAVVVCWALTAQLCSNIIQIHGLVQTRLGRSVELGFLLAPSGNTVVDAVSLLEGSSRSHPLVSGQQSRSIQDIQREGRRVARSVCQSIEYFRRIDMGTFGCHATTYPSWSARQYFRLHPGHERERLWVENMHRMEGPGTRWGLSLMTFADIDGPL